MNPLDILTMGDSTRIDYIIREHEKLSRQVRALSQVLKEKGLLTQDEFARVMAELTSE